MEKWLHEVSDFVFEIATKDKAENQHPAQPQINYLRGIYAEMRLQRKVLDKILELMEAGEKPF